MTRSLTSVRVHKRSDLREEGASLRERNSGVSEAKHTLREHTSVMVQEAIELLALRDGDFVVDATAGSGGHSEMLLKEARVTLLAIDADPDAAARTSLRLQKLGQRAKDAEVVVGNFGDFEHILASRGIKKISKVLFDFGWNMEQLSAGRGFSFMQNEPLDMRYGETAASGFTAAEILNTWKESAIADALFGYGEERYARRIAKAVVARRETLPIRTTLELVEIINDAVPGHYRHGKIHPATRSFQALRIAVNDELGVLERGLKSSFKHLEPGGRIAVITFHSIEDRLVKHLFLALAKGGAGKILTKKPIIPSADEVSRNRPSRSAKLRGIEKLT
jgi:16S rRNA (cytosine1402-N4)-methyltransferase